MDRLRDHPAVGQDAATRTAVTRAKADRAFAHKAARGFGPRGRLRQRAYVDALRDLTAPVMGRPPVIRAAAPDGDGAAAYARVRGRARAAVGLV